MSNKESLQKISEKSLYSAGVMPIAIKYCFSIFKRHFTGSSILEMGPAEGVMTECLITTGREIHIVEGSRLFCEKLAELYPSAEVVNSLFEDFVPGRRFDNIIMGHVLEHVDDPVMLLKTVSTWLEEGGRVFAAVPNSRSLHRQAAVIMGLLSRENQLNDLDIHHGHKLVFDPESFRNIFLQAGFNIEVFGGYWLKPLSNGQLQNSWDVSTLEAFMALGERYPDIAGEIYIVASPANL